MTTVEAQQAGAFPLVGRGGLTAAAKKLDLLSTEDRRQQKTRPFPWQTEAWRFFDELGEIGFAATFVSNAMSRVRLVAGWQGAPGDPPIPLDEDDLPEDTPPSEAAVAIDSVGRLRSRSGGQAEIMRGFGTNLFLPGEALLVGRTVGGVEDWQVFSNEEIIASSGASARWKIRTDPTRKQATEELPSDAFVLHLWRRHPRWSSLPTSPMRSVLELCDELQILTRMIRASALSSLNAGVWLIPRGMTAGRPDNTASDHDGEAREDAFVDSLIEHLTTPIKDPRSAAAIAPNVIAADPADIEAQTHVSFARPVDATAAEQRSELVHRIATGLDLPPEILTGKADVNHWTAWAITEDTFRSHIEPLVILVCSGLTTGYLWPALQESGVANPEQFVVWYDPADLVSRPNEADNAKLGHDAFVLSDATFRGALGYGPDDAPDEEEIEQRIAIAQAVKGAAPQLAPAAQEEPERVAPAPSGEPPEQPPAPEVEPEPPAALLAGAGPEAVGARLAAIDRTLRVRVQQAADEALRTALNRAGARLRTLATRKGDRLARQVVADVENPGVAQALGPTLVAALAPETDLLAGAFDGLEGRWHSWVRRARAEIRAEIERAGVMAQDGTLTAAAGPAPAELPPEWEQQQEANAAAGWAALLGGLADVGGDFLFNLIPGAPAGGEFDDSTLIPPGVVRSALVTAGGGPGADGMATGLSTSASSHDLMDRNGLKADQLVWLYGDPSTRMAPFEPHRRLDGTKVDGPSDPKLLNTAGVWPGGAFFLPGDHAHCQCDLAPVVFPTGRPPGPGEPGGPPGPDEPPAPPPPPGQQGRGEMGPWHPDEDFELDDNIVAGQQIVAPDVGTPGEKWTFYDTDDVAGRYKQEVAEKLGRRMNSTTDELVALDHQLGGKWSQFVDPDIPEAHPALAYQQRGGTWNVWDSDRVRSELEYLARGDDSLSFLVRKTEFGGYELIDEAVDAFDVRTLSREQVEKLIGWPDLEFHWSGTPDADLLVRENIASDLVHRWAVTSNDEDSFALAVQEVIRDRFDLNGTYDWDMKDNWAAGRVEELLGQHRAALDDFVGSMYDETQAFLRSQNVTELHLVRGFNWSSRHAGAAPPSWADEIARTGIRSRPGEEGQFGEAAATFRPASSFTTNYQTAHDFAGTNGTVVYVKVPAELVLGMPRTGWGCLGEHEWVLLGGTYRVAGWDSRVGFIDNPSTLQKQMGAPVVEETGPWTDIGLNKDQWEKLEEAGMLQEQTEEVAEYFGNPSD